LLIECKVNNIPGVTSSAQPKVRVRRSAEDRRAEIVDSARRIALTEGISQVTLRSVADDLSITSGLVSHYFPAVDGLLAEAFGTAARTELDDVFGEAEAGTDPLLSLSRLLRRLVASSRDDLCALWIDAWHSAKRRPALNDEVVRRTEQWVLRLTALLERGRAAGQLVTEDPRTTAVRILAVLDGLSVQVTQRGTIDYESVAQLVFHLAENELGLPAGALAKG